MTSFVEGGPLFERARKIRLIAFDVDGVCTDGRLYYGAQGERLHAFFARDGLALILAKNAGLVLAALTGRRSEAVQARLDELGVHHIRQGLMNKTEAMTELLKEHDLTWEQAAFIGDDVNDIPCLKEVGLSLAVLDAAKEVADHTHGVTSAKGGHGALRELIEGVMRAQDLWPTFG